MPERPPAPTPPPVSPPTARVPGPPPPARQPEAPEARWEDVVDPEPVAAPTATAPAPTSRPRPDPGPPASTPGTWPEPKAVRRPPPPPRPPAPDPVVADARRATRPAAAAPARLEADVDDDYDDDEEYDDEPTSRWISLLATVGTALIGIVTIQVLATLAEGLALKKGERVGVPDDILHRLGYPFGGLGSTALVFLVLGVILVSMPSVLDELLSETQDRVVGAALVVAIAMGVIIALGSLLAVRANLHEYAAKGVAVPSYVRVQFTNFLLGSLGAAALALFGSITAIQERARERTD